MQQKIKQTAKAGFTLVELAIVLVIIGLIVGGVLVGQDLIKAAEIRATMSDIESYNASATTFRNKYNGLPGDLLASRASQYGLTDRAGSVGQGNGNSLIEGCGSGQTNLGCETAIFWADLSSASLIADAFTTATDAAAASITGSAVNNYLPNIPIRETAYVHIFPQAGRNYFYIGGFASGTGGAATSSAGLTPTEAAQIDEKADDGLPTTGIVRAVTGFTTTGIGTDAGAASTAVLPDTGECVTTSFTPNPYNNVTEATQAAVTCRIYYRASF